MHCKMYQRRINIHFVGNWTAASRCCRLAADSDSCLNAGQTDKNSFVPAAISMCVVAYLDFAALKEVSIEIFKHKTGGDTFVARFISSVFITNPSRPQSFTFDQCVTFVEVCLSDLASCSIRASVATRGITWIEYSERSWNWNNNTWRFYRQKRCLSVITVFEPMCFGTTSLPEFIHNLSVEVKVSVSCLAFGINCKAHTSTSLTLLPGGFSLTK